MTAQRMCQLGRVSRASVYRFEPEAEHPDENLDLRDEVQRIALDFPCYGRPPITAELKRRGWAVNHKRVGQIMREDNVRHRAFAKVADDLDIFAVMEIKSRAGSDLVVP